jgi:hypothetical protein
MAFRMKSRALLPWLSPAVGITLMFAMVEVISSAVQLNNATKSDFDATIRTATELRGQSPSSELCGVSLPSSVARLRKEVESKFGKSVNCKAIAGLRATTGDYAKARVYADGTPWVLLDKSQGAGPDDIAHELFHLKLTAEGFTSYAVQPAPPDIEPAVLLWVVKELSDLLLHRLFFPQMRSMGFDPTAKQRRNVELMMQQDRSLSNSAYGAVHYVEDSLLVNDNAFSQRVDNWYRRSGWTQELAKGKAMEASILSHNPRRPRQIQRELLACLNILFGNKFTPDLIKPVPFPIHPPSHPENVGPAVKP